MKAYVKPDGFLHRLLCFLPLLAEATHFFCAFSSAMVPDTLFCATAAAFITRRGRAARQFARQAGRWGLILI